MGVLIATDITDASALLAGALSPVVVIPVYNAYEDVVRCLESVVTHTSSSAAILIVDDGGSDRRTARLLETHGEQIPHTVVVLEHDQNQGYVRSCNDAFRVTAGRDVVIVNSDVVVGAEWLDRLTAAALSSDSVATATTLTNHGTIVSVPYRNHPVRTLPDHLTPEQAARRVAAGSRMMRPEIPTGIGHCLYVKRAVVDLIGTFDETFSPGYGEEVDFCQRAVAHGFRHVVADDVFTFHRGGGTFGLLPEARQRRALHDEIVHQRYPWYTDWVAHTASDRASSLADALSLARRALLGLTVGVDALCLGPELTGTQLNTIESVRALAARPEIARLVVFVPENIGRYALEVLADLSNVETISVSRLDAVGEGIVDVLYRPYQVREPVELEFLHRAGDRFVVNQLDTIAYENPAYFHDTATWSRYRDLTRLTLELASGVAFPSAYSRESCLRLNLARHGQPSAVVSSGTAQVLAARSAPIDTAQEIRPGFLLGIGTSYLHKNRQFTLQVWAELRRRGWGGQLIFAGPTPPFGNSLAAEAEFLLGIPDLRPDVIDVGGVTEEQKLWLYEGAAMVLYPSTTEGFGLVPFEAAQHGVPTLSTRRGSLDEVLPADIPALDGFDVGAAADQAWKLLHDRTAARALSDALAARAVEFTWAQTAQRLVGLFEAALAQPRGRILELEGEGGRSISATAPQHRPELKSGARRLEHTVQAVIDRPGLKRALSPDGSRRQAAARGMIEFARRRLH